MNVIKTNLFLLIYLGFNLSKMMGQNFVPNAGFEINIGCPNPGRPNSDINSCPPWKVIYRESGIQIINAICGTIFPNQCNQCPLLSNYRFEGNGIANITYGYNRILNTDIGNYIYVPLTNELEPNQLYLIGGTSKVIVSNASSKTINYDSILGFWLFNTPPKAALGINESEEFKTFASLLGDPTLIGQNKFQDSFSEFRNCFRAKGGEKYLLIGINKKVTDTFEGDELKRKEFYGWIDNIFILPSDIDFKLRIEEQTPEYWRLKIINQDSFSQKLVLKAKWNEEESNEKEFIAKSDGWVKFEINTPCFNFKDSIFVELKDFSPNVFAPNIINTSSNQDKNRFFLPIIDSYYSIDTWNLSIYNRWGNRVFNSNNKDEAWDAKINGIPAEKGIYIWTLQLQNNQFNKVKNFVQKGNFLVE